MATRHESAHQREKQTETGTGQGMVGGETGASPCRPERAVVEVPRAVIVESDMPRISSAYHVKNSRDTCFRRGWFHHVGSQHIARHGATL